jgi:hypothetical protein
MNEPAKEGYMIKAQNSVTPTLLKLKQLRDAKQREGRLKRGVGMRPETRVQER